MALENSQLAAGLQQPSAPYVGQGVKPETSAWPMFVGVLVTVVHLILLPYIDRTWRTTGDEPHYLLAAHSLATDFDIDLTNNYDQLDYLNFYFSKEIVRQVRRNAAGQEILNHQPGLPIIMAPAYAAMGRFGVLAFQAAMAGLLAFVTFKLALVVSRNQVGAGLATLFVAFSPPLFLYTYLIYPELLGALLTTIVLYYLIASDRPSARISLLVIISLATLPWLNRRFIPLALLLALLTVWVWSQRAASTRSLKAWRPTTWAVLSLTATIGSVALLVWFNSQLSAPVRADFVAPTGTLLWQRFARGVGWLVDQQRGLFIFGPIYLLIFWGLPLLIRRVIFDRNRHWLILVPFLVSLGVTAAAGGFWVAWELGPRYLVVALPALAPLIALAWQQYCRYPLFVVMTVFLFLLSLLNAGLIIRQPELPYKSSLPLYYGDKLNLPLVDWLPDLASYRTIWPTLIEDSAAAVIAQEGEAVWVTEAGSPVPIVKSEPLSELSFGHYQVAWPVRVEAGLPPTTELMRISIKLAGGGTVFNQAITAADLPNDGRYGLLTFNIFNRNVDRWRTPPVFQATSSGQSEIQAKAVRFTPVTLYSRILPYGYLLFLLSGGFLAWYAIARHSPGSNKDSHDFSTVPASLERRETEPENSDDSKSISEFEVSGSNLKPSFQRSQVVPIGTTPENENFWPSPPSLSRLPLSQFGIGGWGVRAYFHRNLAVIMLLAALGYLLWSRSLTQHTYDVREFQHFVGQPASDPEAADRRAWRVDPAVDPPQKAIYGPFDIYDAGRYQAVFRLKSPQLEGIEPEIARLQVNATANLDQLITQPIFAKDFSDPNRYRDFTLTFENPRRQSLSFEVHYLGLAALVIDQVVVKKIN